jgi:diguanylate cyclase (GGDEF)-like protein
VEGSGFPRCRSCGGPLDGRWAFDTRTGLLNWPSWTEEALNWLHGRLRADALLMIDVDHFKSVNDRFGHLAGDTVLQATAEVLRSCTRRGDLLGRYGGDEFVVLLPATDHTEAMTVAERIGQRIRELTVEAVAVGGAPVTIGGLSVSIGLVVAETVSDLHELLLAADTALLTAKRAGRDQVSVAVQGIPYQRTDSTASTRSRA